LRRSRQNAGVSPPGAARFGRDDEGWAEKNGRAAREKQVPRCARNDNQKDKDNGNCKGNGKDIRRSRSLRDDNQKGKDNGKGNCNDNYRGPSLRSG
jgi:hypothetical protein